MISAKAPLRRDLLKNVAPVAIFKSVSDQLAWSLSHFQCITPSPCDTNQLWMKGEKKKTTCKHAQGFFHVPSTTAWRRGTKKRRRSGEVRRAERKWGQELKSLVRVHLHGCLRECWRLLRACSFWLLKGKFSVSEYAILWVSWWLTWAAALRMFE